MNEENELNHPGAVCHMHGLPCNVLGEVLIERDALRSRLAAIDAAKSGEPPMPGWPSDGCCRAHPHETTPGCDGLIWATVRKHQEYTESLRAWGREGWDAAAALRVEAKELRAQARASITTEEVERALGNYRCARTISEDGDYLPLADMLTPPGQDTIALGLEERALLADFLASVLATREFAAASQGEVKP